MDIDIVSKLLLLKSVFSWIHVLFLRTTCFSFPMNCLMLSFNSFFFFFWLHRVALWDLSSPIRDWTQALSSEPQSCNHWPSGNSPFHSSFGLLTVLLFIETLLSPVLLRCSWPTALCKFRVYNIMIWLTYMSCNDVYKRWMSIYHFLLIHSRTRKKIFFTW